MSTGGKIPVIELFGPTIQGEGLLLGVPTHFLRLGGCGYRCSWCDSMHAVEPAQVQANRTMLSQDDIITQLLQLPKAPYVTLTGGDPCIQENLHSFVSGCGTHGYRVAVETQGQYFPDWLKMVDVITFSPKGPSSRMNTNIPEFRDNLVKLKHGGARGRICVKVVVFNEYDLEYALEVLRNLRPSMARPLYDLFTFQVGSPTTAEVRKQLQEAGIDTGASLGLSKRIQILERYEWLVDAVLKHPEAMDANVTITPQEHTLLWPTQDRGR